MTKEIQSYMKAKARGESPDKGLTFEQEVELVRQSYQKLIDIKKGDCADLQEKIDSVKDNSRLLDKQIINLNVDVCECKLNVDEEVIRKEKELIDARYGFPLELLLSAIVHLLYILLLNVDFVLFAVLFVNISPESVLKALDFKL